MLEKSMLGKRIKFFDTDKKDILIGVILKENYTRELIGIHIVESLIYTVVVENKFYHIRTEQIMTPQNPLALWLINTDCSVTKHIVKSISSDRVFFTDGGSVDKKGCFSSLKSAEYEANRQIIAYESEVEETLKRLKKIQSKFSINKENKNE